MPEVDPLGITAEIDGRLVPRSEVLAWEARRARKVFAKLGLGRPSEDLPEQREALVRHKLELGHGELERRLTRELRWSGRSAELLRRLSGGRRSLCSIELTGSRGSAEAMPGFYRAAMESGEEAALLRACPDHYVLCRLGKGIEKVVETTGGSPLSARIFLEGDTTGSLRTPADPAYPVQWTAVGRPTRSGPNTGGIRHQFRDGSDGFRARLIGEFPAALPGHLVSAHRWHLACEFSNWIEAANSV